MLPRPGSGVTSGARGGPGSWPGPWAAPRPRGWFCGSGHHCRQPTSNCHTKELHIRVRILINVRKQTVQKIIMAIHLFQGTGSKQWILASGITMVMWSEINTRKIESKNPWNGISSRDKPSEMRFKNSLHAKAEWSDWTAVKKEGNL